MINQVKKVYPCFDYKLSLNTLRQLKKMENIAIRGNIYMHI